MDPVDINDDSIKRFAIFHHRFDPETNHFKWVGIKAFSKKREWKKYLTKAGAELALRRASNEVSLKEHISGHSHELKFSIAHQNEIILVDGTDRVCPLRRFRIAAECARLEHV